MIRAIIFDWFGVCAERWLDVCWRSLKDEITSRGGDFEDFRKAFVGNFDPFLAGHETGEEFLDTVLGKFGIDGEGYHFLLGSHGNLNRDVPDTILTLRKRYKTAIITDISVSLLKAIEELIGSFDKYFDVSVHSCHEGSVKIEGRLFHIALEKLGVQARECIFIDDRARNIEKAREIGFKTILFENAEQMKKDLVKLGVQI